MAQEKGAPASGGWKMGLAAAAGGLLIGALAVALYYGVRVPSRAETEAIVHNYILDHGEILPKAMERLEQRQAASAVSRQRAALERPWHGAWAGAANGDVVLVEFFDYACTFCRASNPDVARLIREDPRLKVVWRELPVLGPDSQAAAYVSLGAARQGRFRQFHDRMFALGRPTGGVVAQAVQETGVAREAESAEARAEIARNIELARTIGASGTPTFVIGDQVLQGAVGYDALKAAIAAARGARRAS
jgi:protein-disulfide isomerase